MGDKPPVTRFRRTVCVRQVQIVEIPIDYHEAEGRREHDWPGLVAEVDSIGVVTSTTREVIPGSALYELIEPDDAKVIPMDRRRT